MLRKLAFSIYTYVMFTTFIVGLEYKKNFDILKSGKSEESKVKYINNYEEIRKIIFDEKKNAIAVFYADWCPHW